MRYLREYDVERDGHASRLDVFTPNAIIFMTTQLKVRPRWRRAVKALHTYRAYRLCGLRRVPAWRLVITMVLYRG